MKRNVRKAPKETYRRQLDFDSGKLNSLSLMGLEPNLTEKMRNYTKKDFYLEKINRKEKEKLYKVLAERQKSDEDKNRKQKGIR